MPDLPPDPPPSADPPKRRRRRKLTKRETQTQLVSTLSGRAQQLVDEEPSKPLGKRAAKAEADAKKKASRAAASQKAAALQGYTLTEDGEVVVSVSPQESLPIPPRQAATVYRVAFIRELMARGEWNGHETYRRLTIEWGVGQARIKDLAAEASRSLALDPDEIEAAKRQHGESARRIFEMAIAKPYGTTARGEPGGLDGRVLTAALEANSQWAKFRGIDIDRKQVEVTGKGGVPLTVTMDLVDSALAAAATNAASAAGS